MSAFPSEVAGPPAPIVNRRFSAASLWRRIPGCIATGFFQAVFPLRCVGCGRFLESRGRELRKRPQEAEPAAGADHSAARMNEVLCAHCRLGVQLTASPVCTVCGAVFASRLGADHYCRSCIQRPQHYHRARAAAIYNPVMMRLIHAFKYAGKIRLAVPLAALLQDAFQRYWPEGGVDLVLPIPLHRRRFRRRGFNQAFLLMRPRRRTSGPLGSTPTNLKALIRVRATPAQAGLGRADRQRNIRGAFQVQNPQAVSGRRVLLIDDVYTTGATVDECSRVLLQAGAARVEVLTLARAMPRHAM